MMAGPKSKTEKTARNGLCTTTSYYVPLRASIFLVQPVSMLTQISSLSLRAGGQPTTETLLLDAVQSVMRIRKDLPSVLGGHLLAVQRPSDHRPIDWWLVCAMFTGMSGTIEKRRLLSDIVKKAAKQTLLTPVLLRAAIYGHSAALRPHYATQLEVASELLRSSSSAVRRAGTSLYQLLFEEFSQPFERQAP